MKELTLSARLRSAPALTNTVTVSVLPLPLAQYRGVLPFYKKRVRYIYTHNFIRIH